MKKRRLPPGGFSRRNRRCDLADKDQERRAGADLGPLSTNTSGTTFSEPVALVLLFCCEPAFLFFLLVYRNRVRLLGGNRPGPRGWFPGRVQFQRGSPAGGASQFRIL